MARTPIIAGNWKMNLDHLEAAHLVQSLAWTLKDQGHDYSAVEVVVVFQGHRFSLSRGPITPARRCQAEAGSGLAECSASISRTSGATRVPYSSIPRKI